MSSLAIVTICRNDRAGLERTFASLHGQTDLRFAHVVVDGGSTDGSVDLIRSQAHRIARWVSEPDSGIYAAMNKGWRMAEADFILFINSGDGLADAEVIGRCLPLLDGGIDIAYGDLMLMDDGHGGRIKSYPDRIDTLWLLRESPPHPSQCMSRALLQHWGGFEERYRIAADYAFFARAFWTGGLRTRKLPFAVGHFDTTGISSSAESKARLLAERKDIQRRYAPWLWYAAYQGWARFNRMIGR
jgi:glycosyltransferase involved in cell wall biosynthesis